MKISLCALALSLLTGCLTATVPTVSYWYVTAMDFPALATTPKFGVVRVSQVTVRSPFDSRQLTVRRADGSLAFDSYNNFAALPSQIFKAPVIAALAESGLCKAAVDASSSAAVNNLAEAIVTDLVLTADAEGALTARVTIVLRMLDAKRNLMSLAIGEGKAAVEGGSYTKAYSTAFNKAIRKALAEL